jgi:hypothetical protein
MAAGAIGRLVGYSSEAGVSVTVRMPPAEDGLEGVEKSSQLNRPTIGRYRMQARCDRRWIFGGARRPEWPTMP